MNRHRSLIRVVLIVLISVAAAGCAEGGGDPTEAAAVPPADLPPTKAPPTMAAAESASLEGKFDIGGFELFLACIGTGEPVVLLEEALPEVSDYWNKVQTKVAETTRVCRYDRAGKGLSDPSPKRTRSSVDMAEDLHALLQAAEIPGPYVMAGHSFGGLLNLEYAGKYPDEAAGIVLIDSLSPAVPESDRELAAEFDKEPIEHYLYQMEGGVVDLDASFASVANIDSLGDMPLVILSAAEPWPGSDDYSVRGRERRTAWQLDFLGLSSNSRHVVVEDYDVGNIVFGGYLEVSEAILDVVAQVRGK